MLGHTIPIYIVVWVIISIIMCTKILNEKIQTSPWVVAPWRKCKSWIDLVFTKLLILSSLVFPECLCSRQATPTPNGSHFRIGFRVLGQTLR
jgi:hypothetical protein